MASVLLASQGQLTIACGLIFLAAVFDVFDGLAARALGGGTPLGAQLDSLADMVSFGVAPGIVAYQLMLMGLSMDWTTRLMDKAVTSNEADVLYEMQRQQILAGAMAVVISIGSAWRLAKFNIDTRQSTGFLGLPTPANALFWVSVPLGIGSDFVPRWITGLQAPGWGIIRSSMGDAVQHYPFVLLAASVLLGILMLSELPLPSLKFKHKGWKGNEVIFLLIAIGAVLTLLYGILAVPLILIIYLLSPLWGKLFGASSPKP